jgi:primosomal protein N' (replication factor Y)
MLAKGHNFPWMTLVGILNADLGLKVPDFRSGERTFQLLTQVAGRAGRAELPGRVILQTYSPEHPAIVHAVAQDFEAFAAAELPYREAMAYPPYSFLTVFRAETEDPLEGQRLLAALAIRLAQVPGLRILGPMEGPIPKLRDRYHWRLILKARTRGVHTQAIQAAALPPGGPLSMDRDPVNLGV